MAFARRVAAALVPTLVVAMSIGSSREASALPGVPEIPAPWLNDIAVASLTPQGPVIYFNPTKCKEVGPSVCAFFREHEYGHVRLNHSSPYYTSYVGGRALAEAEADCYAAKNAMLVQVKAAITFFQAPPMASTDSGFHGTGLVRAQRIKTCRGI